LQEVLRLRFLEARSLAEVAALLELDRDEARLCQAEALLRLRALLDRD
jgi:DNA-directed RNA polymerase specialized sigma24 family protein